MTEQGLHNALRRFAATPMLRKKLKRKAIGLFLLPDSKMRAMKSKFLPHEKGPANVLAFPEPAQWPRSRREKHSFGEVYLNRKFAKGKDAPMLILHGVLHLLGYDHKKKSDRIRMERMEKIIIKKLGY